MISRIIALPALAALALTATGCDGGGLSTADVQQAAKERVRESLDLTQESTLFTDVFVGEPTNGDTVICGTVEGSRADGARIAPRRFIAATDPARWIKFDPANGNVLPSQPDKFLEWHTTCLGERAAG
jgi:hypothetical protein